MAQHRSYVINRAPRVMTRFTAVEEDESFVSYVDRIASKHHITLAEMISRLGLVDDGRSRAPTGWGAILSEEHLVRSASVLRLAPERVSAMLMSRFDGIVIDLSNVTTADPDSLRRAAQRNWAYFSGSHFCPTCVRSGAWKLPWKLPWSFACPEHSVLLRSDCPQCHRRAASGRKDGWMEPTFHARVPRPGHCGNSLADGFAGRGKASEPCGFDLSQAETFSAAQSGEVLRAQRDIHALLAPASDEDRNKAQITFQELRSLAALIHYAASLKDLGKIPEICEERFELHVRARLGAAEDRAASHDGRRGPRPRSYVGTPRDPILMAAILPTALRIVKLEDVEGLRDELMPLVNRLRVRGATQRDPWPALKYFHFSDRLATAARLGLERSASFDRRVGKSSSLSTSAPSGYTFDARHVPQLIPESDFDLHFAEICKDVVRNNARRFCSMALIKLKDGITWTEAAEALDIPAGFARFSNRMTGVLNSNGTYERFALGLRQWAEKLSADSERTDFQQRRRQFADFQGFSDVHWAQICADAAVGEGYNGSRRRYAAAWLWSYLTSGDWRLSPAMNRGDEPSTLLDMYGQFAKTLLPALAPHLRLHGQSMLGQAKVAP